MKFAERGGIFVLLGGLCPTFWCCFSSLTILPGQSLCRHPALDLLRQAELAQTQPP